MPSSTPKLISVNAAAERVSVNPRTIRRYISDGKLRAYRVGGATIRVSPADVDALAKPIPTAALATAGNE